jgi:hypothetical protein
MKLGELKKIIEEKYGWSKFAKLVDDEGNDGEEFTKATSFL